MVEKFLEKFVDVKQPMETSPPRFSTLVLLIKSARKLSGRNIDTGDYEYSELNIENFANGTYHSLQFSGLISYLILLEQIGSIFKPKNKSLEHGTPIVRSLKYFSDVDDYKIESIVSLYPNDQMHIV